MVVRRAPRARRRPGSPYAAVPPASSGKSAERWHSDEPGWVGYNVCMPQSLMEQLSRRVGFGPTDQRHLLSLVKPLRTSLKRIVKDFAAVLGEDAGARLLLDAVPEDSEERRADLERIVALLGDSEAGVRTEVEAMLRSAGLVDGLGPALAAALRGAGSPGLAMRLVRVIAHLSGSDFGYDPGGGFPERRRVADAFTQSLESRPER